MSRAKTQFERNAFVKGLVTEASPLTFPENASIDELNFFLNRDGSRQRRLGLDYENGNVLVDTRAASDSAFSSLAIATYKWDNVNNDPNVSLGVVQVGYSLFLFDLFASSLSAAELNYFSRGNLITGIAGNEPLSFAAIDGKLVIASSERETPAYLTASKVNSKYVFTITDIDITVRDIWGVYDGLEIDDRPVTLSDEHKYNLMNQGWSEDRITTFKNSEGVYPSNADIVHFGKKSDGGFESELITGSYLGTTPAGKGKYLLDAFNRGEGIRNNNTREGHTGIDLNADKENGRISEVTSYSGRVFYTGVKSSVTAPDQASPSYSGTIFYSQTIESGLQFGRCYQMADPTSEDLSDLVATDGGTIKIPQAGQIVKLAVLGTSLVVIADNGVWSINGVDGVFKATEYSVKKVTNVGCISAGSVVEAEQYILYWADAGIYILQSDQVSGNVAAQNMTETSIQSFYNDVPSVGKATARGHFDSAGRMISWLFNDSDDYDGIEFKWRYNKELRFDTVLQAFYVYDIKELETDSPYVAGYMPTQTFSTSDYTQLILVDGEQVQVDTEDVGISEVVRTRGVSQTKYLTYQWATVNSSTRYHISFAEHVNSDFKDWNQIDADAYVITGYELFADSQRNKSINYLTTHFRRTEDELINQGGTLVPDNPSQCWVQTHWGFADSPAAMQYGSEFQAYRLKNTYYPTEAGSFDYGLSVVSTKNKLRGHGRAISFKFRTEPSYDCNILGWAFDVDGQTNV